MVEFRKLKKKESSDASIYIKVEKEGEEKNARGKMAGKKRPKTEVEMKAVEVAKTKIKVEKIKKEENGDIKEENDEKVYTGVVLKREEEN